MSDQSKDPSISHADPAVKDGEDEQAKVEITASGQPETALKTSYYLLMLYAAVIGAGSSLLTVGSRSSSSRARTACSKLMVFHSGR